MWVRKSLAKPSTDEKREEYAKQLHERIIEEYYRPAVQMLENQYKDHIEENERLKEEIILLKAKLEGFELAKELFIDGYRRGIDVKGTR